MEVLLSKTNRCKLFPLPVVLDDQPGFLCGFFSVISDLYRPHLEICRLKQTDAEHAL